MDLKLGSKVRLFLCHDIKLNNSILLIQFACAILGLIFAVLRFDHIPVGSFFDDAHYIVLAKSLFSGQGYRLISFPHAPIENAFPPGWPILLGLYFKIIPFSFFTAKLPAFFFWISSIYLSWHIFASRLPQQYALLFLATISLNPNLIGLSGTVMSEPAYLFFSLTTIYLYKQWQQQNKPLLQFVPIILAAIITLTIRSIGISLLLALLVVIVYHFRQAKLKYWLLGFALLSLFTIPLLIFNRLNGGFLLFSSLYSDHVFYIASNFGSFLKFWEYEHILSPTMMAHAMIPIFNLNVISTMIGPTTVKILSFIVVAMVFMGVIFSIGKRELEATYFIFYLVIFYFWAIYIQDIQPRITIPLIPFMLFYFIRFIILLKDQLLKYMSLQRDIVQLVLWGIVFCCIAFNLYTLQTPFYERVIDLNVGNSWLKENSSENAIVMSTNPVPDYLYSQRQTVKYNRADGLDFQLDSKRVDYILIHPPLENQGDEKRLDPFTRDTVLSYLEANPAKFELVFQERSALVWVFKVH